MIRISLADDDFNTLVTGGVVKKEEYVHASGLPENVRKVQKIEIALDAIGFDRMKYLLAHAEAAGQAPSQAPAGGPICACGSRMVPINDTPGWARCQSCGQSREI